MDQIVKMKELEMNEQKIELDFLAKEQELIIQRKQLALEEAKMAVTGVKVMSDIEDKSFQRTAEHVERVATARPGTGETELFSRGNTPDVAEPHEIMSKPTGI